jgi:hypothetical protein
MHKKRNPVSSPSATSCGSHPSITKDNLAANPDAVSSQTSPASSQTSLNQFIFSYLSSEM